MTHPSRSAETAEYVSLSRFHAAPQSSPCSRDATSVLSRLSISQMTTCRWSFMEDVLHYREAGIESLAAWRPKLCDFGEERCVDLVRDSGMRVTSLGWAGGFTGANGHSFDEAVDDAQEAIRDAAALGAESLTIISGAQQRHIHTHAQRLLVEGLEHVLDQAAEKGVTLALQPMHGIYRDEWTFLNTLDEALEILDRLDHPYLRLAFGTYHLWEEPRLLDRIGDVVPYLATVQLSDWRSPRCDNDRVLPGDGEIPLAEIVAALEQHGYDGAYEMEIWSTDLWKGDYFDLLSVCRDRFVGLFDNVESSGEQSAVTTSRDG